MSDGDIDLGDPQLDARRANNNKKKLPKRIDRQQHEKQEK